MIDGESERGTAHDSELSPDVAAQIAVLEEENRRLRDEYRRLTQTQYRRTGLALTSVGMIAVIAAFIFSGVRDILLILGAIGIFGGILTFYLTPERFVSAILTDGVSHAVGQNIDGIRSELGLSEVDVYVPVGDSNAVSEARLYIPQSRDFSIPDADLLRDVFVAGDTDSERGVSLVPTASNPLSEFERSLSGELAEEPGQAGEQLLEGLVEQFELLDGGSIAVSENGKLLSITLEGSTVEDIKKPDNPIVSFFGAGIALATRTPVSVSTELDAGDPIIRIHLLDTN